MSLNSKNKRGKRLTEAFLLVALALFSDLGFASTTGYTRAPMNFRSSPNGRDIGGVPRGERFEVLEDTGSWVKIKRNNGRTGWIWKKYVTVSKNHRHTTTEMVTRGQLSGVSSSLNVRKSPTTRSRRIGDIDTNDRFEIIGEASNGWYKVRTSDGTIGYASDNYIDKLAPRPVNVPTPQFRPDTAQASQQRPKGRFAGTTSDDLKPDARAMKAIAAARASRNNPGIPVPTPRPEREELAAQIASNRQASLVNSYAPASAGTEQSPFDRLLRPQPNSGLQLASASAESEEDAEIQAECNDCLTQEQQATGVNRDVFELPDSVLAWHKENNNPSPTSREKCYGEAILKAAKENVRRRYGNRSYSTGQCAYGVRTSLQRAGLRVGGLGHAIDYHKQSTSHGGTIAPHGFVNEISKYQTAENAPAGAILVFSGPRSDDYLRNPGRYRRGNSIVNRARGTSAGDYVGHVTVKGDDGKYYTDGRTADPAIANRYLVGIYVLKDCKSCSSSLKRQCGG